MKNVLLEISHNSQVNTCARFSFSITLQVLGLQLYFKKRLWRMCFPANFAKFLRTLFWQDISGRLPLKNRVCKCALHFLWNMICYVFLRSRIFCVQVVIWNFCHMIMSSFSKHIRNIKYIKYLKFKGFVSAK